MRPHYAQNVLASEHKETLLAIFASPYGSLAAHRGMGPAVSDYAARRRPRSHRAMARAGASGSEIIVVSHEIAAGRLAAYRGVNRTSAPEFRKSSSSPAQARQIPWPARRRNYQRITIEIQRIRRLRAGGPTASNHESQSYHG